MDIKRDYPDYAAIEEHIRRAHLERSLVLSQMIADIAASSWRGGTRLFAALTGFFTTRRSRPAPRQARLRSLEIGPYLGR